MIPGDNRWNSAMSGKALTNRTILRAKCADNTTSVDGGGDVGNRKEAAQKPGMRISDPINAEVDDVSTSLL
jgi:hypothetical protein